MAKPEDPWLFPEVAPEPAPQTGCVGADEDLPRGPYSVGQTYDFGTERYGAPYTLKGGDGRCFAGHIESLRIAERIAALLNAAEASA